MGAVTVEALNGARLSSAPMTVSARRAASGSFSWSSRAAVERGRIGSGTRHR